MLPFLNEKRTLPGSRRENPASLGGLGKEWRRLPPQDTLSSLPASLFPLLPGWGGFGAEGISQEGGNHLTLQPQLRVSLDRETR